MPTSPQSAPSAAGRRAPPREIRYPRPWPWIALGLFTVLALPGGMAAWSAVAEISGAVIGQGTVTVETNVKTVQHLDGGIVSEILVRNGDRVAEGDILIRLDETTPRANLGVIAARLNELYAQRARLESERTGATEVAFPGTLAAAAERDERIAALLTAQRSLFVARLARHAGEKTLLAQQIGQFGEQVKGLTSEHEAKQRQANLIVREIDSVRPLVEQGLYTQPRFLALEREAARLDGDIGKLVGDIARTQVAITETELKITQIGKDYIQTVLTELREAEGKVAELEERRIAAADALTRAVIRAPRSGYVHNLAAHTVGGVVSPANPILEIIPDSDRLIIEARVAPTQVDQLREGQAAIVRFSAFDRQNTPTLTGHVKKVSAAQLTDRATGSPYFSVIVEVPPEELVRLGAGRQLVPGMPAEAFIQTDARTVLSYLMKPLSDAVTHAFRER
jgi:HlyD family secretion protein